MSIQGKEFMFTGRLSVTRVVAQKAVIDAGGYPGSSVCSTTDYLVVGDSPGSKLEKAKSRGVEVINETTFWELLKEEELAVEEWKDNGIKIVPENLFWDFLTKLEEKQAEAKKQVSKREGPFSWEEVSLVEDILVLDKDLSSKVNLMPVICTHCKAVIPYSVHRDYYYCFNCGTDSDVKIHSCIYTNYSELGAGKYKICKLCGNVKFFEKEEFDKRQDLHQKSNFTQSLEHLAEIEARIREKAEIEKATSSYWKADIDALTEEEKQSLFVRWEASETRKTERRSTRRSEKYEKQVATSSTH